MSNNEILEKIKDVQNKHHELSKNFEDRHVALARDIEALKKKPAKGRDTWDKLSTLTPLISGVLISGIGIYFTHSNNETQQKIQEVQTMEKLIPHLTGDDAEKKMAIIAISTLTNPATAAKIAQMFPSKGTVQALRSIADQGTKAERVVAKQALATSLKSLGEGLENHPSKGLEAQQYYKNALSVQEDVYGANSANTIDTLVRLGRISEKQGRLEDAITFFNKARLTLIHNKMNQTSDFASVLMSLSGLYKATGKMTLATDFANKAKALSTSLDSGKVNDKNSVIAPDATASENANAEEADSLDDYQPIQESGDPEPVKETVPEANAASDTQLFPGTNKKSDNSMDSQFSN